MPQRLAAVRTAVRPATAPRWWGEASRRAVKMVGDGVPPPSAARRDASPYPCMGGPRSRAADNWESRLPGGAFPPRPN